MVTHAQCRDRAESSQKIAGLPDKRQPELVSGPEGEEIPMKEEKHPRVTGSVQRCKTGDLRLVVSTQLSKPKLGSNT